MPIHNQFYTADPSGPKTDSRRLLEHVGAFLPIEVHVPPQIADLLSKQGQPVPPPVSGVALIDTGATRTAVHESALQQLAINPIGVANVAGIGGPSQRNMYPVLLQLPAQGWRLEISSAVGVDLSGQKIPTNPPQNMLVLLGRDLLSRSLFIWNGTGGFWSLAIG